jgi:hypothetical protein
VTIVGVVPDVVRGVLAVVVGPARFQTGGTDPATVFGLVLAATGIAVIVAALVGGRFAGVRRR